MSKQVFSFQTPFPWSNDVQVAIGGEPALKNLTGQFVAPWRSAGNFRDINYQLTTAPGVGKSWVGAVWKGNGVGAAVATGDTVTISGAATTGTIPGPIAVVAGDYLQVRWTIPGGAPAATGDRKSVV